MRESQLILPGIQLPSIKKAKGKVPRHYAWEVGSAPPSLGQHSIAKHRVLKAYLEKYVAILAARPVQEQLRLTLVDGFAGGGAYLHPESGERMPGSPIIMAEAMATAEAAAKQARRKEFALNVEYIFVEKQQPTIEFLKRELQESKAAFEQRDRIQILKGCFTQYLDQILSCVEQRGRSRRVIFVLDQYGFTDVRMADLRRIFERLPNAEVILTLAIDWLIDHWTEKANYDRILADLGINLPSAFVDRTKAANPNDWRPVIQHALHGEFRSNSGAGFYTPFFIHSVDSHRAYWLLHFSGHSKARDVMTQLHWEMNNHFQHFGGAGFDMLGFDPRRHECGEGQRSFSFTFDASASERTLWRYCWKYQSESHRKEHGLANSSIRWLMKRLRRRRCSVIGSANYPWKRYFKFAQQTARFAETAFTCRTTISLCGRNRSSFFHRVDEYLTGIFPRRSVSTERLHLGVSRQVDSSHSSAGWNRPGN